MNWSIDRSIDLNYSPEISSRMKLFSRLFPLLFSLFPFLRWRPTAILNFGNRQILLVDGDWRAETYHLTKFRQNRLIRCRDMAFYDFSGWRPSLILNLFPGLDNQRRVLSDVYQCAKIDFNRYCSFHNVNVFNNWCVWLENAYSRLESGILGDLSP